jgi:hypothetical protein
MALADIVTIAFRDLNSRDEGVIILRAEKGTLGVCVSLREDGDIEVFVGPTECDRLLEALSRAARVVQGEGQS